MRKGRKMIVNAYLDRLASSGSLMRSHRMLCVSNQDQTIIV
jgi:hypothetical protein